MSIAHLRAISEQDLPLIVDDLDEILAFRSLIEGGLVVGCGGAIDITPGGRAVVLRPALIRNVTPMGRQFLSAADPSVDALGGWL